MRNLIGFFLVFMMSSVMVAGECHAANMATAGQDDGYSGRILDKITKNWKLPVLSGKYRLDIILAVDGDGNLVSCRIQKASGNEELDKSACAAARAVSPFGSPPYGMPASIYFSFWSDNTSGRPVSHANSADGTATKRLENSERNSGKTHESAIASGVDEKAYNRYISRVRQSLRNSIYIPVETKPGTYHVQAEIKCDPNGKIISSDLLKKSGDSRLDKYVLQGIHRAGKISPPPAAYGNTFKIDFTLVRN